MPELYRGYIPLNDDDVPRVQSTIDVDALRQQGVNPHIPEYADKLLWTTPNKEFAQGVVVMRFVVKMAIDQEYKRAVIDGQSRLPSLVTYRVKDNEKMWDATGDALELLTNEQLPAEVVLEAADSKALTVSIMEPESLQELLDLLEKRKMSDTMGRATMFADMKAKRKLLPNHISYQTMNEMTFAEAIKTAYDFYVARGLDPQVTEDLLANGLFSATSYLNTIADTRKFTVLSK
jgi:hypothetical protein